MNWRDLLPYFLVLWLLTIPLFAAFYVQALYEAEGWGDPSPFRQYGPILGSTLVSVGLMVAIYLNRQARLQTDVIVANRTAELAAQTANLEMANDGLEAYSRIVSHDLKVPLRHATSYAELLEEDVGENAHIEKIKAACHRMQGIVDGLLDMAVGSQQSFEEVDLNDVVRDVVLMLGSDLEEADGQVVTKNLPKVTGTPERLHLIFQNLIQNAIKYRGIDGPIIMVLGYDDGAYIRIEVKDNGRGFDKGKADRLFTMFGRLDNTLGASGTGIGLAQVKRLVVARGGTVGAASAPGKGSTFWLRIPKKWPPGESP